MVAHMYRNCIRLSKAFEANRTFVRFFLGVGPNVMSQNFPICKISPAHIAFMRLYPLMDLHVRSYVLFKYFFPTSFTDASSLPIVGFFYIMRFHVFDIATLINKNFSTNRTPKTEFVLSIVLTPHVLLQSFLRVLKALPAKWTLSAFFANILFMQLLEMTLKLSIILKGQVANCTDKSLEFFLLGMNIRVPL